MSRLLILLLCLCTLPLYAANAPTSAVDPAEVENAITRIEGDTSLEDVEREKLLGSLRHSLSLLKQIDDFRQKAGAYKQLRMTATAEAERLQAELEAEMAQAPELIPDDISLDDLDRQVQQDKAELAAVGTTREDINNQLQHESTRTNELRTRQSELKKNKAENSDQAKLAVPETDSNAEAARKWQLRAEADAIGAELVMLDEELLSQPMRLKLLKARQDSVTHRLAVLRDRIKAGELFANELRKGEAEKALSEAESVEQEALGKHPLILQLAERNTALSAHAADLANKLQGMRAEELGAREEANLFEKDLQTIQRKLEIVGMSEALGQVLRDQQLRLPNSRNRRASTARREQLISASSLRQFEFEEERRKLRDAHAYVTRLTEGLAEPEARELEADLLELALARKELVGSVLEAEGKYLRTLGELDFTARRLSAAADAYSAFISERLLWIRTSSPLSLSTFTAIPAELARVFAPKPWFDLFLLLPGHVYHSVLPPFLLLVFALMLRSRGRLLASLKTTGDRVGNVDADSMLYSFQALGLTVLLAVQWPILLFAVGVTFSGLAEQSPLAASLAQTLESVSYYYFGMEILRLLVHNDGLARRHFHWSVSTLQPLDRRLLSLERVFIPSVIIAIIAESGSRGEGGGVITMFMLISAQVALALFFARMPPFMESKLDHLMVAKRGRRRTVWGKLVRQSLVLIPCLLITSMLLGYGAASVQFLVLLLLTIALFAGLLIVNEFGVRWLRLLRLRLIKAEREAALAAAAERSDDDEAEVFEEVAEEADPDALDDNGRKLLTALLGLGAVFGVWAVWADVLPALGILNTIDLWTQTAVVDGQDVRVPVTLADIGVALIVGFAGYVAIKRVPALLEFMLRQKIELQAGTVYAVSTLFRYGLVTLVVVVVLGLLGWDWSQIQWAVAALSVGIGFGLQEIVANFISGLILLFEQPIRVGDTVTVGETSGVVTRIRMRATTIRDWDRRELLVPNKEFITGRLLNWSLSDQLIRFVVVIGVAYGTNLKKAMELALEAARENAEVLDDPEPFITFDEFGDNSLQLVLRCFIGSVDKRVTTASQVRMAVDEKYNDAGIVVAFPQQDVHLDTSVPLEINVRNLNDDRLPAQ